MTWRAFQARRAGLWTGRGASSYEASCICCGSITSPAPLPAPQERMANNHVYVFRKSQPSKYAYVAECRCGVGCCRSWLGRIDACGRQAVGEGMGLLERGMSKA